MSSKRDLNVSFTKSGSGSMSTRLTLPITWMKKMNITKDDRVVEVTFDEDKQSITIIKK